MQIIAQSAVYVAMPEKKRLDPLCTALWRRAGSEPGWRIAGDFFVADFAHDVAQAIFEAEIASIPRGAGLYVIDRAPPFYLGPISDLEADTLAGAQVAMRRGNLISTAISACGLRLLLRLCSEGILEVVIFARPLRESGFISCRAASTSSTTFVQYRRFEDTVAGRTDTGTRVVDCARRSIWRELDRLISTNKNLAAARFAGWFKDEINPHLDLPFALEPGPVADRDRDASAEARAIRLVRHALNVPMALTHPARIKLQLPTTALGRARVIPESLFSHTPLTPRLQMAVEILCGLAAYDLPGHAAHIAHHVDSDPTFGHAPSDIVKPYTITVATLTAPSGHERIAAHAEIARFWEKIKAAPDLADRLAICGRGLDQSHLLGLIEQLVGHD